MKIISTINTIKECFQSVSDENDKRYKIPPLEFLISFILSISTTPERDRSLESIRKNIKIDTLKDISRSGCWERIATKKFTEMLLCLYAFLHAKLCDKIILA